MPYCTGKGLAEAEMARQDLQIALRGIDVQQQMHRFPDSRVSTKTMLMTTSMLSNACNMRPTRYRTMRPPVKMHDGERESYPSIPHPSTLHYRLRVTYSQLWNPMSVDQGPFPHLRPHPDDGMGGAMATPGM